MRKAQYYEWEVQSNSERNGVVCLRPVCPCHVLEQLKGN